MTQAATEITKANPIWGTGRRKTAIARVRLIPGDGTLLVNDVPVDDYFSEDKDREAARSPLVACDRLKAFDIFIRVTGGGHTGQADACKLGIARALKQADSSLESILRDGKFLTRDARMKERKKYGRRGARRSFQFSKR